MIGKFFAPQLPPSPVEWGSEMHFGPVFMSNHCHQNNGAHYRKILCKWAIMEVNDNLVRPCSRILLWSEILLIFLKHNTKYTWQILDEKVPVVRLCGQPARSQAHPATKRGRATREEHTTLSHELCNCYKFVYNSKASSPISFSRKQAKQYVYLFLIMDICCWITATFN